MFPTILIVDDETTILQALGGILSDDGFVVISASNGYEALKLIDEQSPDLVLLDIWMPGMDGIDTLREIKRNHPFLQVIMISGHGNIETAVRATKLGAFDFIEKPLSIEKVIVTINNALNFRRLEEENRYLRKKTLEKHSITGNSAQVQALRRQIAVAAPTNAWILITGENGTGKELVARTIHQMSNRVDGPLIEVNCAAIPDDLIESELFGHEATSPASGGGRKRGKFEIADRGTIFLDEIGDMSLKAQSSILRMLQEQKFERVGGSRTLKVDVRVLASTNKDLEKEITRGTFREDLYYRLNVIPIDVPALRDRLDDIPILAETFLREMARDSHFDKKTMSEHALEHLKAYHWPGNVRELKNLVERLAITTETNVIDAKDLPKAYKRKSAEETGQDFWGIDSFNEARRLFERTFLMKKLTENNNNVSKTATLTGLDEIGLKEKIRAFKL